MDERNNDFDFDFTPIGQAIKKARETRGMTREQVFLSDVELKVMPLLRFLTEPRRVDKVKGIDFRCKLVDAVADGGQLPQDFIKLWVWLFAEPIALDH